MFEKIERIALLVALIGVFIALLTWLMPFDPIGPSPLGPKETDETTLPAISTPTIEQWTRGNLLVNENFDELTSNNWIYKSGSVEIVKILENEQPNNVLQLESGFIQLVLPKKINDYVVETKIMQVSDTEGLGIVHIRMSQNPGECYKNYKAYIDVSEDWVSLVEDDPITCGENRSTGLFGARRADLSLMTWYTLRIEAKGEEVRVFLDDVLLISDQDNKLNSNIIALSTCCGVNQFYFDDVRIWELP